MIFIILFILRITILYLFIKYLIYTKGLLNRFILLLVLFFYCLINFFSIPNFRRCNPPSKLKTCFANIRILQGAIEMYNMDHATMMTTNFDMNALVKSNYIKSPIKGPEEKCEYLVEGDLTSDGYIYCANHGDVMGLKAKEIKERKEKEEREKTAYHLKDTFSGLWALETKIDNYLSSLLNFTVNNTIELLLYFGLVISGLGGPIVTISGFINSITCLTILRMFKCEKEEKDIVVYEASEELEDLSRTNETKDSKG